MINSYSTHQHYYKNRLNKEYDKLSKKYKSIIRDNLLSYRIHNMNIHVDNRYPFSEPIVSINNTPYIGYYKKMNDIYNLDITIRDISWIPTLPMVCMIKDCRKYNILFSNEFKKLITQDKIHDKFDNLIYELIFSYL
jgi:hypothetical protein